MVSSQSSSSFVIRVLLLPIPIIPLIAVAARHHRPSATALLLPPSIPPSRPFPSINNRHRRCRHQLGHRATDDGDEKGDDIDSRLPSTSRRRDALFAGLGGIVGLIAPPSSTEALLPPSTANAEYVDVAAFNDVRRRNASSSSSSSSVASTGTMGGGGVKRKTILPSFDPPPLLSIRGGKLGKSTMRIPRVGHSLYKTKPEEATRCVNLALRCGIRHFDLGTAYGSNVEAGIAFADYLDGGGPSWYLDEKPELMRYFDDANDASRISSERTLGFRSKLPSMDGSAGRRGRRESLFVSHKISNDEQSSDKAHVKRRVRDAITKLGVGYLDLVSIHSPLTDAHRRCNTYEALLELRDAGFVRSVGVCNYGMGPLEEIRKLVIGEDNFADLPAINQLELSPFNTHSDVVRYCDMHGISVGCSAWSKLSGVDGPSEGWSVLSDLARDRGMTKAQVLVRWSMQRGYVCVPRSGSKTKVERMAIAENSYGGVNPIVSTMTRKDDDGSNGDTSSFSSASPPPFVLTDEDMKLLDGLDVGYKAGKLGRRDGWDDDDVCGPDWDPTDVV
jgi:diketogulonate reductase-like aldo/keto reductase